MTYILYYVIGIIVFQLWDAFIGFGFDFYDDIREGPTAWLAALFWPAVFPIALIAGFGNFCAKIKSKRKEKSKQKEKIRIALQEEQEHALKQVEEEMAIQYKEDYEVLHIQNRGI